MAHKHHLDEKCRLLEAIKTKTSLINSISINISARQQKLRQVEADSDGSYISMIDIEARRGALQEYAMEALLENSKLQNLIMRHKLL